MKLLGNKFHIEGEQIVKTSNGEPIPDDEPVFILRGRDVLAVELLETYQTMCRLIGCNGYQMQMLSETLATFRRFTWEHGERMKKPGCTLGR